MPGNRIKLHRRCWRKNEAIGTLVEFRITYPKTVTTKQSAAQTIPHNIVMTGVSGCVYKLQLPAAQRNHIAISNNGDSVLRDGLQVTKNRVVSIFTVNGHRPGLQFLRSNHMRSSTLMNQQLCVGQDLHQSTCATGVVQMNMCRHNPAHLLSGQTMSIKDLQKQRQTVAGPGINKGRMISLPDEITRCQSRAEKLGIYTTDTMLVVYPFRVCIHQ